ncbi:MAG: hypothetical protein O2854_02925 [Chloroflexi bacterium]|nr:hypothetical protein [Chloroflexota bacterium]
MSATKKKQPESRFAGVGDAAVQAKTGKTWQEWFVVLDTQKASDWPHPQIASYLNETQGVSGWWSQMVTVGYEQARGLRQKHETSTGYQVSVSKTLQVPLAQAYELWADEKARAGLIPGQSITVRTANVNKNLRALWSGGSSTIEVQFYDKGISKCQVVIQHNKLPDADKAAEMKAYWKAALEHMKESL